MLKEMTTHKHSLLGCLFDQLLHLVLQEPMKACWLVFPLAASFLMITVIIIIIIGIIAHWYRRCGSSAILANIDILFLCISGSPYNFICGGDRFLIVESMRKNWQRDEKESLTCNARASSQIGESLRLYRFAFLKQRSRSCLTAWRLGYPS